MEYKLTKEQTYYLEKCYAYIVRSHSRVKMYQEPIYLNGIEYNPGYIKKCITDILINQTYNKSDKYILNNLKDYYIQEKLNEKQGHQRDSEKV